MFNKKMYSLTTPQMSIYLSEQFVNKPINNIGGTQYFKKNIDIKILKKAINATIKNNETLRTIIIRNSEEPKQYFKEFEPVSINVYDFSEKSMEDFKTFEKASTQKRFKLFDNKLYRFKICILPNDEIAVVSCCHHIITDAWGMGLISKDIAENYTKISNGLEIPDKSTQYTDFIKRENKYLKSDLYKKNKEYWIEVLKDAKPISIKNTLSNSLKASRSTYDLTQKETTIINEFCKKHNISAYVLFLAVLNLYLYKTIGFNNFSIQTPVFNRISTEKEIVGMFINMISVKMKNNNSTIVNTLLKTLSTDSFVYFKNSKYPYIHILKALKSSNNLRKYNIVYSFQKTIPKPVSQDIVPYRVEWIFSEYMQDEFVFNVSDINNSGTYSLSYDYLTDLFVPNEVDYIHNRLKTILFDIIANYEKTTKEINILPKKELELLNSFNNSKYTYDNTQTIPSLFEQTVKNHIDDIALIYNDISYTYRELNNMSNIIAEQISKQKLKNSRIAILCKKSPWLIASLLGIMKSGNCYVPIDAEYPEERIKYIIQNSNAKLVITSDEFKDLYKFDNKIYLEDLDSTLTINFTDLSKPNDYAYIIYTSGTTGNPKGVKIKHKNIVNTLIWRKEYYKFDTETTVLQIPSFSFDSSVEDIFSPLISGAKLIISTASKADVNIYCDEILKYKVNHFLVVPSLYKILLHEKCEYLNNFKYITIAGESFTQTLVTEHFTKLPHVRLINEYGPTENSVCSTFYELSPNDEKVLIGKPINNCKCYVLNNNLERLPIGVKGELYVSGPGVSEGYLNLPAISAQRFLDNPFNSRYKMYKTGDIVSMNFSGNLEFFGRDDNQIKLHGFRIELSEIEKRILKNKEISDVVVVVKETINNSKKLFAYIISPVKNFDSSIIFENLKKTLPFYMLPTIVQLDSFPLTPNGKIDKDRLPMPKSKKFTSQIAKTELEATILDVCKKVLQNKTLDIDDDLFAVGEADSLDILTINSRLFTRGIVLNTQDFYKYSTIRELAKKLVKHTQEKQDINQKFIKPKETSFPKGLRKKDISFNYNNVLLTGCTGFLGIHILDYLLKNTDCMIYCIIREKYGVEPEKRLQNLTHYYFDKDYYKTYRNRIIVLNGDLSKDFFDLSQEDYSNLQKNIDCIINSAANTKHYGNAVTFERENVSTLNNLILFAKPTNTILNHMSTTTVSGNYLVDNDISYNFTENDFYIGQNYQDNVYVNSKFEAEKLILEEEQKGLRANIFRLGNLMARHSDGIFQKNKLDNAYYTRIIALAKIGKLPNNFRNNILEFSPIDDTACAIIKLLSIPNIENHIFHVFSNKLIPITTLLNVLKEYGYNYEFVDYNDFIHNLQLSKNEKVLKYLVSDLDTPKKFDYSSNIVISQNITKEFLDFLGFEWSEIDKEYLKRFFDKNSFTKTIN